MITIWILGKAFAPTNGCLHSVIMWSHLQSSMPVSLENQWGRQQGRLKTAAAWQEDSFWFIRADWKNSLPKSKQDFGMEHLHHGVFAASCHRQEGSFSFLGAGWKRPVAKIEAGFQPGRIYGLRMERQHVKVRTLGACGSGRPSAGCTWVSSCSKAENPA